MASVIQPDGELESLLADTWTEERVAQLLMTNDKAVLRALYRIYLRQCQDERQAKTTSHKNGIGFTAADARFLSRKAAKLIIDRWLPPEDIAMIRPIMLKYRKQLLDVIASGGRQ